MESDDDVKGDGLNYTTEYRQYDPRVGRWFSSDPIVKPWESPYAAFANNPVYYIDPAGLEPGDGGGIGGGAGAKRAGKSQYDGEGLKMKNRPVMVVIPPPVVTQSKSLPIPNTSSNTDDGGIGPGKSGPIASKNVGGLATTVSVPQVSQTPQTLGDNQIHSHVSVTPIMRKVFSREPQIIYGSPPGGGNIYTEILSDIIDLCNTKTTYAEGPHRNSGYTSSVAHAKQFDWEIAIQCAGLFSGLLDDGFALAETETETASLTNYYPENGGAYGDWTWEIAEKGQIMDRFGLPTGNYASPYGTPFEMRSLPPNTDPLKYFKFEIMEPILIQRSLIAPAFGQPGMGTQFRFLDPFTDLERWGIINIKK